MLAAATNKQTQQLQKLLEYIAYMAFQLGQKPRAIGTKRNEKAKSVFK